MVLMDILGLRRFPGWSPTRQCQQIFHLGRTDDREQTNEHELAGREIEATHDRHKETTQKEKDRHEHVSLQLRGYRTEDSPWISNSVGNRYQNIQKLHALSLNQSTYRIQALGFLFVLSPC